MTFQPANSLLSCIIAKEWKQFSTSYALYFTGVYVAQQIALIVRASQLRLMCMERAEGLR